MLTTAFFKLQSASNKKCYKTCLSQFGHLSTLSPLNFPRASHVLQIRGSPWMEDPFIGRPHIWEGKRHMAGVQNSWSKGLYKVGTIGIEKLILHLRYEAGPIGNDAVHKLGASIALAWR